MTEGDFASVIGPALAGALAKKGYTELTPVQLAVLDPALAGRDLRITSQTGSGKTVAIGLVLRDLVLADSGEKDGKAHPRALFVTPTRELAKQVEEELAWLYAPLNVRVASVTGGASVRDERRALSARPAVVVGTPGRMLDHLTRGAIDTSDLDAVILDEADRMLDLGFRDEIEAILKHAPAGHRTHLVSATFPREVRALADRVQTEAAHVEGTRLGAANIDIDHVIHLVAVAERVDAIVNLLLANSEEQTLIFARTRADVAEIASQLRRAGFATSSLSGEMEQEARNRALAAFKKGDLRVLVATDVAARGIDVQDIARVIHAEPPTDADSYTHRSGRTGRAGRKGTSSLIVVPHGLNQAVRILERARVPFRFEPVPTGDGIRKAIDERLVAELGGDDPEGFPGFDNRTWSIATRLAESGGAIRTIARLLLRVRQAGTAEPRDVRPIEAPTERKRSMPDRIGPPRSQHHESPGQGPPRRGGDEGGRGRTGVPFFVTWGELHGADARRLLAMMCRRGGIRGSDVGAIRVGPTSSVVEISSEVAGAFAESACKPDPRDPRVVIRPEGADDQARGPRGRSAPRDHMRAAARPSPSPREPMPPAPRIVVAPPEPAPRIPPPPRSSRSHDQPKVPAPPRSSSHAARPPREPAPPPPRIPPPPRSSPRIPPPPRSTPRIPSPPRSAPHAAARPPRANSPMQKSAPEIMAKRPSPKGKLWGPKPKPTTRAGDAPPIRRRPK